jgi:hypothetical protein
MGGLYSSEIHAVRSLSSPHTPLPSPVLPTPVQVEIVQAALGVFGELAAEPTVLEALIPHALFLCRLSLGLHHSLTAVTRALRCLFSLVHAAQFSAVVAGAGMHPGVCVWAQAAVRCGALIGVQSNLANFRAPLLSSATLLLRLVPVLRQALEYHGYDFTAAELAVAVLSRVTQEVHDHGAELLATHVAPLREVVPVVQYVVFLEIHRAGVLGFAVVALWILLMATNRTLREIGTPKP